MENLFWALVCLLTIYSVYFVFSIAYGIFVMRLVPAGALIMTLNGIGIY